MGSRLDSDWQAAALARLFAAEVARDGVAVIVVPPLPLQTACQVWGRLIDALPDQVRQGIGALLPIVPELRAIITAPGSDPIASTVCALDLCAYDGLVPAAPAMHS
jgi:hypothetical protein